MKIISILSLSLFLVFLVSFLLKLFILYKKNGIKANVLAKGVKGKTITNVELFVKITTFVWGLLWFTLSIMTIKAENFIGLAIEMKSVRYAGITVLFIGVSIFITAMVSMKTSWRVGIDKKTESKLVTAGIYKYSRNPAFVGFDVMFLGLTLTYPSFLVLTVTVVNVLAIHMLILQEEKHLKSAFGDKYVRYKAKTPRYILFNRSVQSEKVS
ncbi:MAG: isoprenylcysteine carboxylmethyltransferase family protein [Clostridia bacterium]|nr:isoprenylcysteine carboxylmethyltransferase family protein [Clostridia bacterium]